MSSVGNVSWKPLLSMQKLVLLLVCVVAATGIIRNLHAESRSSVQMNSPLSSEDASKLHAKLSELIDTLAPSLEGRAIQYQQILDEEPQASTDAWPVISAATLYSFAGTHKDFQLATRIAKLTADISEKTDRGLSACFRALEVASHSIDIGSVSFERGHPDRLITECISDCNELRCFLGGTASQSVADAYDVENDFAATVYYLRRSLKIYQRSENAGMSVLTLLKLSDHYQKVLPSSAKKLMDIAEETACESEMARPDLCQYVRAERR